MWVNPSLFNQTLLIDIYLVSTPLLFQRIPLNSLMHTLFGLFTTAFMESILRSGVPSHRLNAHVILLAIAKFSSVGPALFCIPISNAWEHLFPHSLPNRTCFFLGGFAYSTYFIYMELYNIWPFCVCFFTSVSRFIHNYSMCQYFIPFNGCIIFYCMDRTHFLYPFISWWLGFFFSIPYCRVSPIHFTNTYWMVIVCQAQFKELGI